MPEVTQQVSFRGRAQTPAIQLQKHFLPPSLPLALIRRWLRAPAPSGNPFSLFLSLLTPSTLFPRFPHLRWSSDLGSVWAGVGVEQADQGLSAGLCAPACVWLLPTAAKGTAASGRAPSADVSDSSLCLSCNEGGSQTAYESADKRSQITPRWQVCG